jgi:hypothetical protein
MTPQEAKISRLLNRWKPRLMLDNWAILTEFADEDRKETAEGDHLLAQIVTNPVYTEARITIYPIFFKEPYGQQVSTLVHELCHIHTHNVRGSLDTLAKHKLMSQKHANEISEAVTEQMSKMLIRSYKRGKKSIGYHL